jgi:hypothetical protein
MEENFNLQKNNRTWGQTYLLDPCTQSGSQIAHYHLPVALWCKSHPDIDSANHLQRTPVFHMPHNPDIPETRSAITVCT